MASAGTCTVYVIFTGHENIGECPECHFDSLERFTFGILQDSGVTSHERTYCPRCKDIARG